MNSVSIISDNCTAQIIFWVFGHTAVFFFGGVFFFGILDDT